MTTTTNGVDARELLRKKLVELEAKDPRKARILSQAMEQMDAQARARDELLRKLPQPRASTSVGPQQHSDAVVALAQRAESRAVTALETVERTAAELLQVKADVRDVMQALAENTRLIKGLMQELGVKE